MNPVTCDPINKNLIEQALAIGYGITSLSVQSVPGGWSAVAYKVSAVAGEYFLKVYDKQRHSTRELVAGIDNYMPTMVWLYDNTELRQNMAMPILTDDGSYKYDDGCYVYLLAEFLEGRTIGDSKLSSAQVQELAGIIGRLHTCETGMPASTCLPQETFDVSFCSMLEEMYPAVRKNANLNEVMFPYMTTISSAISILRETAACLCGQEMNFRLCHTDLHGWNLLQSDRLILLDWEGLKLAPVEADLFSFTNGFFFDYARGEFLAAYVSITGGYRTNETAMRYYRLKRRLTDIYEFIESVLFDNLAPDVIVDNLNHLEWDCRLLAVGLSQL